MNRRRFCLQKGGKCDRNFSVIIKSTGFHTIKFDEDIFRKFPKIYANVKDVEKFIHKKVRILAISRWLVPYLPASSGLLESTSELSNRSCT